jgi:hypothetical protein
MAGLRESAVGRAFLVAVVLSLAWGVWNLTVRPYGEPYCDGPLAVVTSEPEEPTRQRRPRVPPSEMDRDGDGFISELERNLAEASRDIPPATGAASSYESVRQEQCRAALNESGFWFRGLGPLAFVVVGGVALRYITTGSVGKRSPQDPSDEDVVR